MGQNKYYIISQEQADAADPGFLRTLNPEWPRGGPLVFVRETGQYVYGGTVAADFLAGDRTPNWSPRLAAIIAARRGEVNWMLTSPPETFRPPSYGGARFIDGPGNGFIKIW